MKLIAKVLTLSILMILSFSTLLNAQLGYIPNSQICRLLDTRLNSDGTIDSNEIRIVSVDPAFSSLQGGTSDCGVPPEAKVVKIIVIGRSIVHDGGYFRVFNADGSSLGTYSSHILQLMRYTSSQLDVPVGSNLQVAIHSVAVESHAVVDLVGYYVELD